MSFSSGFIVLGLWLKTNIIVLHWKNLYSLNIIFYIYQEYTSFVVQCIWSGSQPSFEGCCAKTFSSCMVCARSHWQTRIPCPTETQITQTFCLIQWCDGWSWLGFYSWSSEMVIYSCGVKPRIKGKMKLL